MAWAAWFTSAGQALILLLAILIVVGIGWLVWKRALLDVQQRAMDVQSDVIIAYAERIKQLEESREQDASAMQKLREQMEELRGEIRGQRDLAQAIIETIADTRVCLNAPGCENRIVPTV